MKTLVTGADGFIGSHLTEQLVRRGEDVKALVMYNSFNSWGWLDHLGERTPKNLEVVAGDVRDPRMCADLVRGCDRVLHLAALIAIPHSYVAPDSYVDTNVKGTLNLLIAARDAGVRRFVQTSTSEVYGTAQYVPIDESHRLNAQSPYAASKVAADQLALSFCSTFDLPVVIARPFNTYGPRQSARAVIPTIITQLLDGTRVRLGSTRPSRDFCFVDDTVSAFVTLQSSDDGIGEVFNFGSGHEVSIGDTAVAIASTMGLAIDLEIDESRVRPKNSEVERLSVDVSKFSTTFGWSPSFAGAEGFLRGLNETVQWFSNPDNLSKYKTSRYNT